MLVECANETVLGINLHAAACASLPIFTMSKSYIPRTKPFPNRSDPIFVLGNNRTEVYPEVRGQVIGPAPRPVKTFCDVFFKKVGFLKLVEINGLRALGVHTEVPPGPLAAAICSKRHWNHRYMPKQLPTSSNQVIFAHPISRGILGNG